MFLTTHALRRQLLTSLALTLLVLPLTACGPDPIVAAVDAINSTLSSIKAESQAWRDQVQALADQLKEMEDKGAKDAQQILTNTANDVSKIADELVRQSSDAIEARIAQGTSELMCSGDWLKDGVTQELTYLRDSLRFWDSHQGSAPKPPAHRTCWVQPSVVPLYATGDHWSVDPSAFENHERVVHIYGYNYDNEAMPTLSLTDGDGNVLSTVTATPSYSTHYLLNLDLSGESFPVPEAKERLTLAWPDGQDPTTISIVRHQPAKIAITGAAIKSVSPRVGEPVRLEATVVNTGDEDSKGFDVVWTTGEDGVFVGPTHVTTLKPNDPLTVDSEPFTYKSLGVRHPSVTVDGTPGPAIDTKVLPSLTGLLHTGDTCDEIRYDVDPGGASDSTQVKFTLRPDGVSWWKEIDVPTVGGHYVDLQMTDGSQVSKTIPAGQLDTSKPLRFWKAKAFGVHTRLDYTWQGLTPQYVDPLAGSAITLTWTKDAC